MREEGVLKEDSTLTIKGGDRWPLHGTPTARRRRREGKLGTAS